MKCMKKLIILCLLLGLGAVSCSDSDDNPCSSSANIDDPNCNRDIPDITDRPITLGIKFKDSHFYNQNTRAWETITGQTLDGGIMNITLPIYSNFLNMSESNVVQKIRLAKDQFERPTFYNSADFSTIPYIEVEAEDGVDYLYSYTKRDLNNNIIFERTGQMLKVEGRALLPFVNTMFGNQFYTSGISAGTKYKHSIAIAAQSQSDIGTRTPTIDFETVLQIPNTTFYVDYSSDVNNFNLKDRFQYYYKNNTDFVPNDLFKFLTLKELKEVPEQVPLDVTVVFQTPPKLVIEQEVFFEMPFDLEQLKTNNVVVPQRGYAFYNQRGTFTSDLDFNMKIRAGGQFVVLNAQREFEMLNIPGGTPWDMEFFYDFTQNTNYNSGDGKGLITPLKPECNNIPNTAFSPLLEKEQKTTAIANGGFIATCHPQTNTKLIIPANQMGSTPYSLSDTWYDFFSYIPLDQAKKEAGHLYGIRSVRFKFEGCVRVYARQVGDTNYELKTDGNALCGESLENGWVYFSAEKTATIFDHVNEYDGVPGLKQIIQFFGSSPLRQIPHFEFNRDLNNNRHIY